VRGPRLGPVRSSHVLEPVTGKAVPVRRGEVLRLTQLEGGQCVDLNAFALEDARERLDVGQSRVQGVRLSKGHVLFSNPPRWRPMLGILAMSEHCDTDTLDGRCHAARFEIRHGFRQHTNCQDTLAAAIAEYGLAPDDVHDSFNLWMTVEGTIDGRLEVGWNRAPKGDTVELLACMDTLCVPVVCGAGDVSRVGNYWFTPIQVEVFEASAYTRWQVEVIERRSAAPHARRAAEQQLPSAADRPPRKLQRDPAFEPSFVRHPLRIDELTVRLDDEQARELDALVAAGFAPDREDALRRAFFDWYLQARRRGEPHGPKARQGGSGPPVGGQ
jgi:uncharacterized protein